VGGRPAIELRVVNGGSSTDDHVPTSSVDQPSSIDTQAWVERAQQCDDEAWDWLYRRHHDDVYRHVLYLQGDAAIAEDLTQETFVRAMKGIRGYRHRASFSTWLQRIAINVVRRHWRRTRSRQRTVDRFAQVASDAQAPSPEDRHADASRARALLSALDELPPKLREAFVLRDLMGMPSNEAADVMGISPGHLAVRGHRARAKLRCLLAECGWGSDQEDSNHES